MIVVVSTEGDQGAKAGLVLLAVISAGCRNENDGLYALEYDRLGTNVVGRNGATDAK
jgi:hypothetical protein